MSYTQLLKRKRGACGGPYVVTKRMPGLDTILGVHTIADGSFVITNDDNKIIVVSQNFTYTTTVIGGSTIAFAGYMDGDNLNSMFNRPMGVATDRKGNVLVVDKFNHSIRKIFKDTGRATTMAGSGVSGFDNAKKRLATFSGPEDVVVMFDGSLVVSDTHNHCLRVMNPNGNVWTLCGDGEIGCLDGVGSAARFDRPIGLAVTRDNNVLVADHGNHRIRLCTYPAGNVTTFAGSTSGYKDGHRLVAQFDHPRALALSADGTLLVTDFSNNVVRKIVGDEVSTFAGDGLAPFNGEPAPFDGPALVSTFAGPWAIAIDHTGNVIVTESGAKDRIRVVCNTGLAPPLEHHREQVGAAIVDEAFSICHATMGVSVRGAPIGYELVLQNAQALAEASCETRQKSRKLLHDSEHCDMTVEIGGEVFHVHSVVMRHGSDYFRGLLADLACTSGRGAKAKAKMQFSLSDKDSRSIGPRSFRVVLDFIYTGHAIVSASELKAVGQWPENWTDQSILFAVLMVADYMSLDSMLDAYTQLFRLRLTPETVLGALGLVGDVDGLHVARKAAIEFFVANANLVTGLGAKMHELPADLLADVVVAMAAKARDDDVLWENLARMGDKMNAIC